MNEVAHRSGTQHKKKQHCTENTLNRNTRICQKKTSRRFFTQLYLAANEFLHIIDKLKKKLKKVTVQAVDTLANQPVWLRQLVHGILKAASEGRPILPLLLDGIDLPPVKPLPAPHAPGEIAIVPPEGYCHVRKKIIFVGDQANPIWCHQDRESNTHSVLLRHQHRNSSTRLLNRPMMSHHRGKKNKCRCKSSVNAIDTFTDTE